MQISELRVIYFHNWLVNSSQLKRILGKSSKGRTRSFIFLFTCLLVHQQRVLKHQHCANCHSWFITNKSLILSLTAGEIRTMKCTGRTYSKLKRNSKLFIKAEILYPSYGRLFWTVYYFLLNVFIWFSDIIL